MYIILVYDIGEKRVGKMLKLCRQYLNWVQNSVFEGDISKVKSAELIMRAKKIMDMDTDSLIVFSSEATKWMHREVIGRERSGTDVFL